MEHQLATARLDLWPFGRADVEALVDVFNEPSVRRYLLDDQTVDQGWVQAEVKASRGRFADGTGGLWAVRPKGEEPIIGFTGFRPFFDPPELQLLYGFTPAVWGLGYATEAARAAVSYGFQSLGMTGIVAATDVPNVASVRVMERLGMTHVRTTSDGDQGTLFYAIDRNEWSGLTDRR